MNGAPDHRAAEVAAKLALARGWLDDSGACALRLRGVDWFAWITAGGSGALALAGATGIAEVLVTAGDACILTDEVEAERLRTEEVPPGFSFHVTPWSDTEWRDQFVAGAAEGAPVVSDRPAAGEQPLPQLARQQRLRLSPDEQQRYRALGADAALAMSEAMRAARPGWTEYALAGEGARALWRRGIDPALVMAAGARRLAHHRHPTASAEPLGERAMLAFGARRHGLYANLTGFVTFGAAPVAQAELMTVEATALATCAPGNSLATVYHALLQAYRHAGHDDALRAEPHGGVAGYQAHEVVATASSALQLEAGMAVAFNPALQGIRLEDTFLIGQHGLENLMLDPAWPAALVQGRSRPLWLEAAC
ncbi:peptidase M24 [Massilia eurypsychrophila]|jgi:Xaa-Pro aminopeptidase|uniref:Peptidase M24 n=1 Tax=Massilia eurypsychrophila TaxID=1485217 RepID=A0A2G8TAJ7_9BURK|nr:M24 family metallopeptidase [Massilia eurypsychrophila]PIL43003.1 peptidase M24 [Massilia eurypsychrophila]